MDFLWHTHWFLCDIFVSEHQFGMFETPQLAQEAVINANQSSASVPFGQQENMCASTSITGQRNTNNQLNSHLNLSRLVTEASVTDSLDLHQPGTSVKRVAQDEDLSDVSSSEHISHVDDEDLSGLNTPHTSQSLSVLPSRSKCNTGQLTKATRRKSGLVRKLRSPWYLTVKRGTCSRYVSKRPGKMLPKWYVIDIRSNVPRTYWTAQTTNTDSLHDSLIDWSTDSPIHSIVQFEVKFFVKCKHYQFVLHESSRFWLTHRGHPAKFSWFTAPSKRCNHATCTHWSE